MAMRRLATGISVVLCLNVPSWAAMYEINNPASNIYNPASRMNNPNPLSPPTQPVPQPTVTEATTTIKPVEAKPLKQINEQPPPKPTIQKNRHYSKTARAFINAAQKAFDNNDYNKVVSITEEALKRISAGKLKASKKEKQTLVKYRKGGYGFLEKNKN